jgi:hypothetical protein
MVGSLTTAERFQMGLLVACPRRAEKIDEFAVA